ncbi:hypothetical protein [Nocardia sp. NPDC049149]|uniref:hypothetical protein n=1 Tax=Nocardia sp. NPDC049149 TaxID=3364315 RepID=UPI00371E2141
MSREQVTAEELAQADGERRAEPYFAALHMRIGQLMKAMYMNMSDLTIVLPQADWEGVKEERLPVMLFGCRVVLADVPTAMVAAPAPAGPVAYVTLPADTDGGATPWNTP